VIVCQGRKRGFLGDAVYTYDPHHYLVLSVPLPFESDTLASRKEPMLAVSVSIDLKLAAELVLALDARYRKELLAAAGICSTPLNDEMNDDAALSQQNHFGRIAKALTRIHANYDGPVDVPTLASDAGMSAAAFHAHFKAVTRTTPIQYLKSTRLHKARLLMVQDGVSAATASHLVGYETTSQFSREFKRFFGRTPAQEAAVMRNALIQMRHSASPPTSRQSKSLQAPTLQALRKGLLLGHKR
jgi:AraC-like DNA-binding protein